MDRASVIERFYQCLTCQYTEICNLGDEAEDEQGMCKEYQMDVIVAMKLAGIKK